MVLLVGKKNPVFFVDDEDCVVTHKGELVKLELTKWLEELLQLLTITQEPQIPAEEDLVKLRPWASWLTAYVHVETAIHPVPFQRIFFPFELELDDEERKKLERVARGEATEITDQALPAADRGFVMYSDDSGCWKLTKQGRLALAAHAAAQTKSE